MSKEEYAERVKRIGTVTEAARQLGVSRETVSKRLNGKIPITSEAAMAIKLIS